MAVKTVQTLSGTIAWENSLVDSLGRPTETPQSVGSGLTVTNFWDGGLNTAPAVTAPVASGADPDKNVGHPVTVRTAVDAPGAKFNVKVCNPS